MPSPLPQERQNNIRRKLRRIKLPPPGRRIPLIFTLYILFILSLIPEPDLALGSGLPSQDFAVIPEAIIKLDDAGKKLRSPSTVFFDKKTSETYVISVGRIIIYGPNNFPILSFGAGRDITSPSDIYVNSEGYLYICQAASEEKPSRITVLNAALFSEKEIIVTDPETGGSFYPKEMAIGRDGKFYVAGSNFNGVLILDRDGNYLRKLVAFKDMPAKMSTPISITAVATDSDGKIFLLSEEAGKIYVFNHKEEFLFSFGEKGGIPGKLSRPRDFVLDENDRSIYVVDYMRHTILVYNYKGKFLFEFGGQGWGPGWFNYPTDLAIKGRGNIIVADLFNNRVQVLKVQHKYHTSVFDFIPALAGAKQDFKTLFNYLSKRIFLDNNSVSKPYKDTHHTDQ